MVTCPVLPLTFSETLSLLKIRTLSLSYETLGTSTNHISSRLQRKPTTFVPGHYFKFHCSLLSISLLRHTLRTVQRPFEVSKRTIVSFSRLNTRIRDVTYDLMRFLRLLTIYDFIRWSDISNLYSDKAATSDEERYAFSRSNASLRSEI